MKTIFSVLVLLLFSSQILRAQIIEKESNMSLGVQTGNQLILDDVSVKDAEKLWEDFFKEYGKVKRNRKADEYFSTGVRVNRIFTVSNIDVYAKFEERGSSSVMTLWVDLGMAFVNSKDYPTEYKGVVDLMDEFRIYARTYVVKAEYEDAEKALENLKKDLNKLVKQKGDLEDDIAKYEQKIREAKDDIIKNMQDQESQKMAIDKQIEVLKQVQDRLEAIRKN